MSEVFRYRARSNFDQPAVFNDLHDHAGERSSLLELPNPLSFQGSVRLRNEYHPKCGAPICLNASLHRRFLYTSWSAAINDEVFECKRSLEATARSSRPA